MASALEDKTIFRIKQNDTYPPITEALSIDADPIDLNGATVLFRLKNSVDGTVKVNAAASIVDEDAGLVQYNWIAANTDTAGIYYREWQCTLAGGKIVTVPNDRVGYIVLITDDIQ